MTRRGKKTKKTINNTFFWPYGEPTDRGDMYMTPLDPGLKICGETSVAVERLQRKRINAPLDRLRTQSPI
jgi:hypothetical protein